VRTEKAKNHRQDKEVFNYDPKNTTPKLSREPRTKLEKEKKFYNYGNNVTTMRMMMRMMICYGGMTEFSNGNTHTGGQNLC